MLSTPLRKTIFILILTIAALSLNLPRELPFDWKIGSFELSKVIKRPTINIDGQTYSINKEFDLVLGLDLAGGSRLVFEADTQNMEVQQRTSALESVRNVIERRVNLFGVSEPNVQISSFEGKDRIVVELPGVENTKEAVEIIGRTAHLVFAQVGSDEEPGIFPTDLTGADLESARVDFDTQTGKPVVSLVFTQEGANKFSNLTEQNVGKPLAILLDQEVVSAPIVQEKITGGTAQISGDFTLDAARNLAIQLNAGALPLSINLVEERTVGPTLGAESVERSIRAGIVGVTMVFLFMILAYGGLGIIANTALLVFAILTLALYRIIPVVLTLPGIAGFLLSVAMAVDSNILIFERFKEERQKRNISDALEVSFGRAWDSIRDANIATLFAAFVLANPFDWAFLHTSGPVRGFAITLALGIAVSLFTGIIVSRNLLRLFVREKAVNKKNTRQKK